VRALAEQIGMPVASTFMGKSGIPETHDLALGTIGAIGQQVANEKVTGADVILAVGTCLAPENTKMLSPDFIDPERQKIIQIDTEPLHIGWIFPVTFGVTADAKIALRAVVDVLKERPLQIDAAARIRELKALKEKSNFFTSEASTSDASPIAPQRIIHALNRTLGLEETLVLDGGNNRMFSAKLYQSKRVGQVVGPGGVAGVGWGVPAALAAQLVQSDRRVVSVCGDGGMMMQLYSLAMAREYDLPITYVVLNNSILGNVWDFQAADRKIATEYREPDFARIAESMGCMGAKIEKPDELEGALKASIESDQPALLDVSTAKDPHFALMSG
jgi:acetolactate synthase-1/2/3 large subunit